MTESMMVEAIKAAGGPQYATTAEQLAGAERVADPAAVDRFRAAMGIGGAKAPDPIPFAAEAAAAWRTAQENNQGILHRIKALSELGRMHGPSAHDMIELQYEVMNLSFQQEVVTKVADKASNAIQTLIKNQ